MLRRPWFAATVLALALAPAAAAQSKPSLITKLPEDGTFVIYDITGKAPTGKPLQGTLRLASVGTKDVKGVRHRWVEIQMEMTAGDRRENKVSKFLVAERAFEPGQSLTGNVAEAWVQDTGTAPTKVLPRVAEDILAIGGSDARLAVTKESDTVRAGNKRELACKLLEGTGKNGELTLNYRVWVCPDTPFGVAQMTVQTRAKDQDLGPFTVTVGSYGTGAKSQIKVE